MDRWSRRYKADDDTYASIDKALGTIYIVGEITPRLASQFRQHMRTLERLKKAPAIQVEINTLGGDIEAGLMIVDTIRLSKKPVTTRATGVAMSMGAVILASGSVREALPSTTIMVHHGSYGLGSEYRGLQAEYDECRRLEELRDGLLDQMTGKEPGYWARRHDGKNLYLTPQQALEEKLIDTIVKRG